MRPGEGSSGTDRYTVTWPDASIRNTWLQVMILPGERTGLAGPDVFYFASVSGDTGQGGGPFGFADAADQLAIRQNPTLGFNIATLDNPLDINRSGKVDANDRLIIRQSPVIGFRRVQPITAPGGGGSGGVQQASLSMVEATDVAFARLGDDAQVGSRDGERAAARPLSRTNLRAERQASRLRWGLGPEETQRDGLPARRHRIVQPGAVDQLLGEQVSRGGGA